MSNTNAVVFTGNLGADVDYRVFANTGKGRSELSIAVTKYRPDPQNAGQFIPKTSWVPVKMFGQLAERARDRLVKGSTVAITGHLEEDTWDDKATGQKRSRLYVVADSFEVITDRKATAQPVAGANANYAAPAPQAAAQPVAQPAPQQDYRMPPHQPAQAPAAQPQAAQPQAVPAGYR